MWYKVKELIGSGLNISQIHVETGLDRATVRKYLSLSEKGFHDWISRPRNLPKKLSVYYSYVKETLELQPYLCLNNSVNMELPQFIKICFIDFFRTI